MNKTIKRIGVFTSGGDSPGMNACIRAVVRTALYHGLHVTGIMRGYEGMIDGDFKEMNRDSVSNILHRGGTILKTARSERFRTEEGMKIAYRALKAERIDAVVAIGGDGTFRGATEFSSKYDIPFIGVPGTIDNDLFGTDYTIGYDTALNTVIEAVDKIRDTAQSHDRIFFIEVMGRDAGFIALNAGIAVGSEAILIPETPTDLQSVAEHLEDDWVRKKTSSIVIVAEGEEEGGALKIADKIKTILPKHFDIKVTILGHIQRGGNPTCLDRVLASRLGCAAVEALLSGKHTKMVGLIHDKVVFTPFDQAVKHHVEPDNELVHLASLLGH